MCRTFWHGWKSEIWWNMIKGSLFGDYQMDNFGTLGSTLKLCHHVPSTYRLYIYIIDSIGPSGEYLGNNLLGCSYPHFPLETIMKDFIPRLIIFSWCSNKNYNPSSHFGENMFVFSLWISLFFSVFFSLRFASKTPTPWKPGQRCDCFNHHLRRLKSRTSGITSGWM